MASFSGSVNSGRNGGANPREYSGPCARSRNVLQIDVEHFETVMPPAVTRERDLRLDLFRGIALWLIFLDHIPSNAVNWVTIRNYGFSDAAEIFVFISGYTAAFVYGRTLRERGPVIAGARILRRAWQVYVAHVFIFVIFMAEIAYVTARFDTSLYTEEMGAFDFMQQPGIALVQALLLKFKPNYMDILPLYVVLLLGFAPGIWLIARVPNAALAASVGLYVATWYFNWNFPSYPSGGWFFNPLAWQLIFVFGAWCALGDENRVGWFLRSKAVLALAIAYLVFAFGTTLTWHVPGLAFLMPKAVAEVIYPIDKTNLDILRFIHFLALAFVVVRFVPRHWPGLQWRVWYPAILCGQHSLEVFCLGVFLSFLGHFILTEVSAIFWMQVAVSIGGIFVMIAVASLLRWYKSIEGRRPGSRPPKTDVGLAGGEA
jgi:hypothetical protein